MNRRQSAQKKKQPEPKSTLLNGLIHFLQEKIFAATILLSICFPTHADDDDEMKYLEEVTVSISIKEKKTLDELPSSGNAIALTQIEANNACTAKDLTAQIPNFHLPDYGSQMTSSIYVRGLGARMDQPTVGLIIDNIPILNKNGFDLDLFDTQRIEFLRGPQGTLYGRNTSGGLISLYSLSPATYQGTRLQAGYATGNTVQLKASTYQKESEKFAYSVAANARHTNGLHKNEYTGDECDPSDGIDLRSRQVWTLSPTTTIENALSAGLLMQGGYAYRLLSDDGARQPVNYNDKCHYNRLTITDGLLITHKHERFTATSATSYQLLADDMLLDNDFLPQYIFTLNQKQKEHAVTEELVLQSTAPQRIWNWKTGCYGFFKHNHMEAPVTFGQDGINELILANANQGIQKAFPDERLDFSETELPIESNFRIRTGGVALYHQSEFRVGRWNFTAGLRFDYESARMDYENQAQLHYKFSLIMDKYKKLVSQMDGSLKKDFFEVLPKISALFHLNEKNNLYLSIAKGYKTGGFNTQIFSDILQNKLKNDLMDDMAMKFDSETADAYDVQKAISYDPEYNWTYEVGGHFRTPNGNLTADLALFFMKCRNQQLTVFPKGKNTGRMMTNAGKSQSYGCETSLKWQATHNLQLLGSYGYTHAKFTEYNDGNYSYNGKFVPYAPQHTAFAQAQYTFYINKKVIDRIVIAADWKGTGEIFWDEANTKRQPFYSLFGASLAIQKKTFTIRAYGKNLSDKVYDTFQFKSVGNNFCQTGKPRQIGVSAIYNF